MNFSVIIGAFFAIWFGFAFCWWLWDKIKWAKALDRTERENVFSRGAAALIQAYILLSIWAPLAYMGHQKSIRYFSLAENITYFVLWGITSVSSCYFLIKKCDK